MAKPKSSNGANLGFEEKLWQAADKLRNNPILEYNCIGLWSLEMNKEKYLEDADIILNLDEINIPYLDSFYRSGCSERVSFHINCRTEHGYCEDPCFLGEIKVLEANKCNERNLPPEGKI